MHSSLRYCKLSVVFHNENKYLSILFIHYLLPDLKISPCISSKHIYFSLIMSCVLLSNLLFISSAQDVYGEGKGTPLQYSCLENPMDGGAWLAVVHGVTKSQTRLSDFTFTFYFHALEKEMATHSRVLSWRIPGTGEPGGLPSMGLHRIGHD